MMETRQENEKEKNLIIIGEKQVSRYLYTWFNKAQIYNEIIFEYSYNNKNTAEQLIDGLKLTSGWIKVSEKPIPDKKLPDKFGNFYKVNVIRVVIEKIGAIRDL